MIEYDFSNTYLTREDIKIIKSAKNGIKYKEPLFVYVQKQFLDYKDYIIDDIGQRIPVDDILYQTEKAKAYFIYLRRTKARNWLPFLVSTVISIAALIVAVIK